MKKEIIKVSPVWNANDCAEGGQQATLPSAHSGGRKQAPQLSYAWYSSENVDCPRICLSVVVCCTNLQIFNTSQKGKVWIGTKQSPLVPSHTQLPGKLSGRCVIQKNSLRRVKLVIFSQTFLRCETKWSRKKLAVEIFKPIELNCVIYLGEQG